MINIITEQIVHVQGELYAKVDLVELFYKVFVLGEELEEE